jgi:hypothetical protein
MRKALAWALITLAEWVARDDVNRAVLLRASRLIRQDDDRYRGWLDGLRNAVLAHADALDAGRSDADDA